MECGGFHIHEYITDSLSHHKRVVVIQSNAGIAFAEKTLPKLRREQTKRHEVSMLVYVEDS